MTCGSIYFGSIYKINFPNGKHYIGQTTTSLEQRTKEHKRTAKNGDSKCVYNAIRKYEMVDTLELIEIDTADTIEELCEKEIEYIREYNSYYMNNNGYNMTYGGEGTNGYVYTEEEKQKISERVKKYYEDNPDAREQQSEKMKKYYEDNPDAGKEHSEKMKKYYEDNPEAGKENSERQRKYHEENPEVGKEHGEKMKKYFENPEAIQKCSEAQKKRFENPEEIKKNSERMKKYFEDNPDAGKEQGERIKKYYENNPEARKENSERQRKYHEENPDAGKEHSEKMKKYYEDNTDARRKLSRGKNKPFDVFTLDGIFIKTFTYQFEAKEYLQTEYKITSTFKIGEVLAGNRNSSAGFIFKYN
jgi:hypothetical protein